MKKAHGRIDIPLSLTRRCDHGSAIQKVGRWGR
jgi:hypothetical protein